jgi:hypothetical protein
MISMSTGAVIAIVSRADMTRTTATATDGDAVMRNVSAQVRKAAWTTGRIIVRSLSLLLSGLGRQWGFQEWLG